MAASAIHHCQQCGYDTEVSSTLSTFEENPHCRQCGLSTSESDYKMQEELANMMSQHLHLNNHTRQQQPVPSNPEPTSQPDSHPPITYITQHYHHSSHQAAPNGTNDVQQDVPASAILAAEGINASALFPSQMNLFKHAPPDQKLRLIELWRIAPPTYGNQMAAKDMGNWPQTSMAQEEAAARERWARMEDERISREHQQQHLPSPSDSRSSAEPYIVGGYENLPNINGVTAPTEHNTAMGGTKEHNQAYDPAYQGREWWQHVAQTQPMEHQYGVLQQMKMYGSQQKGFWGDADDEDMM